MVWYESQWDRNGITMETHRPFFRRIHRIWTKQNKTIITIEPSKLMVYCFTKMSSCQEPNVITWGASAAACARSRQWAQVSCESFNGSLGFLTPKNGSKVVKLCETHLFSIPRRKLWWPDHFLVDAEVKPLKLSCFNHIPLNHGRTYHRITSLRGWWLIYHSILVHLILFILSECSGVESPCGLRS